MGWGSSTTADRLALQGGARCPDCKVGTLCLNGGVAVHGHRITTCGSCNAVRCARCGKPAAPTEDTAQGKKYSCTSCK
ncbi:MAG: hypothetical protein PHI63_01805 [Patescibacteria group bacterium]|nr:hypothetical protein [Patescibacteria group bacterium]